MPPCPHGVSCPMGVSHCPGVLACPPLPLPLSNAPVLLRGSSSGFGLPPGPFLVLPRSRRGPGPEQPARGVAVQAPPPATTYCALLKTKEENFGPWMDGSWMGHDGANTLTPTALRSAALGPSTEGLIEGAPCGHKLPSGSIERQQGGPW